MMNAQNRLRPLCDRPVLLKATLVSGLAIAAILSGLLPQLAFRPMSLSASSTAIAQTVDPQIANYARAALEIEQLRQRMYGEAKERLGGNVPANVCGQPEPPQAVRGICADFIQQTTTIIKRNGLSISQFNEFTRRKDSDPTLGQQIQSELLRIQKSTP